MSINRQIWAKPETGGVLASLFILTIICLLLVMKAWLNFDISKQTINETSSKTNLMMTQIKEVEEYEKLQNQASQQYASFKKKKWDQPLTLESLNQCIYDLQKQSKVEFLSIQPKHDSSTNKYEVTLLIKVLRDQSFFNFLQKLESELPGIVSIKNFELKRIRELNSQLAKKVSQGEKISLFEGKIELKIDYAQISKSN